MSAEVIDAEIVEVATGVSIERLVTEPREVVAVVEPDTDRAERNLRLAGELDRGNKWAVARLIAASVEPASHGGDRASKCPQGHLKLGLKVAAEVMGRSHHTIRTYLAAWNAAAADGLCAPSSELSPDDADTAVMPDAELWDEYKVNNSHSAPNTDAERVTFRPDGASGGGEDARVVEALASLPDDLRGQIADAISGRSAPSERAPNRSPEEIAAEQQHRDKVGAMTSVFNGLRRLRDASARFDVAEALSGWTRNDLASDWAELAEESNLLAIEETVNTIRAIRERK